MFPAHAGMNRSVIDSTLRFDNVPRTRGDEPAFLTQLYPCNQMFPAHAGMNRLANKENKT